MIAQNTRTSQNLQCISKVTAAYCMPGTSSLHSESSTFAGHTNSTSCKHCAVCNQQKGLSSATAVKQLVTSLETWSNQANECTSYTVYACIAVTCMPKNCTRQLSTAAKHPSPADSAHSVKGLQELHLSVNMLATLGAWDKVKYAGHALLILT